MRSSLADLAHELNGPLTYLLGYSEMLIAGRLDAAETAGAQVEIYREACRLADLVGFMLEGAPNRRAQPTSDHRTIDLLQLLEVVADRWRTAYPQLQLIVDCARDARVVGNPDRIALALHALVGLHLGSADQSGGPTTLRVGRATARWRIRIVGPAVASPASATTTQLARRAIAAIASAHGGSTRRRGDELDLYLPACSG